MRDSDTLRVSVARFPTLLSVTEEFAEDQPAKVRCARQAQPAVQAEGSGNCH